MELVAAIDLGGTSIKAALVASTLQPVHTLGVPTRRIGDVVDVEQLAELVDTLTEHAANINSRVAGVGVVTPGIVDSDLGVVRFGANLGWRDLPLRDRLVERTKLPMRIGHDVRAGGLAEFTVGAAVGVRNAIFMPVGTGIAAALMVDGHELHATGYAGEIGHAVVDPQGPLCGCGVGRCPLPPAPGGDRVPAALPPPRGDPRRRAGRRRQPHRRRPARLARRPGGRGMKLAECRARELAHRDEGRPRNEVCPRNGPVTHHLKRPTTMANTPELENPAA